MTNTTIEKYELQLLGNLENEIDALNEFSEYSDSTYIADIISEIADSYIPFYNNDIWKNVSNIQEYIEEAISEGIADTSSKVDLVKVFQSGYYHYYTQSLYTNMDKLIYNVGVEQLNSYLENYDTEKLDMKSIESEFQSKMDDIDSDSTFSEIYDAVQSLVDEIKEGTYNNEVSYIVQNWMGKTLATFDSLSDADDYKLEVCGTDDSMMGDIYIVGIDHNGNEFAPQW